MKPSSRRAIEQAEWLVFRALGKHPDLTTRLLALAELADRKGAEALAAVSGDRGALLRFSVRGGRKRVAKRSGVLQKMGALEAELQPNGLAAPPTGRKASADAGEALRLGEARRGLGDPRSRRRDSPSGGRGEPWPYGGRRSVEPGFHRGGLGSPGRSSARPCLSIPCRFFDGPDLSTDQDPALVGHGTSRPHRT